MMKKGKFGMTDTLGIIILRYIILTIASIITVYPILNVVAVALRPSNSLYSTSLAIVTKNSTLNNFKLAFTEYHIENWILHSVLIACTATVISVVISILAAYAFSRFQFRGKKGGMISLLITQMFPATMMLLPLFMLMFKIGLTNKFQGLIIVYISTAVPFDIWMLKGYFDTIPRSLEESAYVDGASIPYSFYKIILPLAKPSIALTTLFSFMSSWSEYVIARVIITDPNKITLPVGLVNMQGQFATDWGIYSAAALITAVPVIILFVCLSKYLVGGLTVGSVKG